MIRKLYADHGRIIRCEPKKVINILVSIVIVALALTLTIVFRSRLRLAMIAPPISVTIKPMIFSTDYNVAILNDEALFNVSLNKPLFDMKINITIYTNDKIINTQTLTIKTGNSTIIFMTRYNYTLTIRLLSTQTVSEF